MCTHLKRDCPVFRIRGIEPASYCFRGPQTFSGRGSCVNHYIISNKGTQGALIYMINDAADGHISTKYFFPDNIIVSNFQTLSSLAHHDQRPTLKSSWYHISTRRLPGGCRSRTTWCFGTSARYRSLILLASLWPAIVPFGWFWCRVSQKDLPPSQNPLSCVAEKEPRARVL